MTVSNVHLRRADKKRQKRQFLYKRKRIEKKGTFGFETDLQDRLRRKRIRNKIVSFDVGWLVKRSVSQLNCHAFEALPLNFSSASRSTKFHSLRHSIGQCCKSFLSWSSYYGNRIMTERLWFRIPLAAGHYMDCFYNYLLQKLHLCLNRQKRCRVSEEKLV